MPIEMLLFFKRLMLAQQFFEDHMIQPQAAEITSNALIASRFSLLESMIVAVDSICR